MDENPEHYQVGLTRIVQDETEATKQLVDPRATKAASRKDLIQLAEEVQRADSYVKCVASNKLQVIAEQIRFLQDQARRVLEEAKDANSLHHAQCNFKKIPGKMYYLYTRKSGQRYFSIISPKEWGSSCPHEFIAAYRLEHDMSWTKENDIEATDRELSAIDRIIEGGIPSLQYLAVAPPANSKTSIACSDVEIEELN